MLKFLHALGEVSGGWLVRLCALQGPDLLSVVYVQPVVERLHSDRVFALTVGAAAVLYTWLILTERGGGGGVGGHTGFNQGPETSAGHCFRHRTLGTRETWG